MLADVGGASRVPVKPVPHNRTLRHWILQMNTSIDPNQLLTLLTLLTLLSLKFMYNIYHSRSWWQVNNFQYMCTRIRIVKLDLSPYSMIES